MTRHRAFYVVMMTLTLWSLMAMPANAYIDAGSTQVVFQVVVGGLAAAGMAGRLFWRRIAGWFRPSAVESDRDRQPERNQ